MVTIKYYSNDEISFDFPEDVKKNKRNLTKEEIAVLNKNLNTSDYEDWRNVLVSDAPDEFDPELIHNSHFTASFFISIIFFSFDSYINISFFYLSCIFTKIFQ